MEHVLSLGLCIGFLQWRLNRKSQLPFRLLHGLQGTFSSETDLLSLRRNFYHKDSGLFSEGLFYNSVMGLNYIFFYERTKDKTYLHLAIKLKTSIFKYLFDDTRFLFYARGHTGFWEKFIPKKSAFAKKMEQFYGQAITEKKKLNSNCMAFIFLYALYRFVPDEFEKGFFEKFYRSIIDGFRKGDFFQSVIDAAEAPHDPRAIDHTFVGFLARLMNDKHTETFVVNTLLSAFQFGTNNFKSYSKMETENGTRRSQCWHDVWTTVFLNSGSDLIYKRYTTETGFLRAAITVDGSNPKKHIFTGDNALFYLLTKLQPQSDVNFDEDFQRLLSIVWKENNLVGESNPKFGGSLWATGDTILSLLATQDIFFFKKCFGIT